MELYGELFKMSALALSYLELCPGVWMTLNKDFSFEFDNLMIHHGCPQELGSVCTL